MAYIPKEYIEEFEKINIYKRAMDITNENDIEELFKEVADRFGKAPKEVKNIYKFLKIKSLAVKLELKLKRRKNLIVMKFDRKK